MSADIVSCSIFISDAICRLVADLLPNITRTFSLANLSPTTQAEKGNVGVVASAPSKQRTTVVDLELELELELEDAIVVVDVSLLHLHSTSRGGGRGGGGARTTTVPSWVLRKRGRRIARPPPDKAPRGTTI
tara:strand:- start:625 stop:1020 length:396 start_codon:yes stop_codon:yes gene_type:complete